MQTTVRKQMANVHVVETACEHGSVHGIWTEQCTPYTLEHKKFTPAVDRGERALISPLYCYCVGDSGKSFASDLPTPAACIRPVAIFFAVGGFSEKLPVIWLS